MTKLTDIQTFPAVNSINFTDSLSLAIGNNFGSAQIFAYKALAAPEPNALLLLGTALAAFFALRRNTHKCASE
jgi:hypothetical protein